MLFKQMILPTCLVMLLCLVGCATKREGLTRFQGLQSMAAKNAPIHVALQAGEKLYLDAPGGKSITGLDQSYLKEISRQGDQLILEGLKKGETRFQLGQQEYIVRIFDLGDTPTATFIAETVNMDAKFRGHPFFLRATIVPTDANRYRKQVYGDARYKDDWIIQDNNAMMFVTNIPQPAPYRVRVLLLVTQPEDKEGPRPVYQEVRVATPGTKLDLKQGQYLIMDVGSKDYQDVKVNIEGEGVSLAHKTSAGLLFFRGEMPGKSKVDLEVVKNTRNVRLSPLEVNTISDKVHNR